MILPADVAVYLSVRRNKGANNIWCTYNRAKTMYGEHFGHNLIFKYFGETKTKAI